MRGATGRLISVFPEDLSFDFELEKAASCEMKVVNNTEQHVAFKVKTTSPKKYFVRPNTGVVQPWDTFIIKVTLQAQQEYPPDMQCKDKFLLQSTKVPQISDIDDIPPDTFSKDDDKEIEECKLRVIYKMAGKSRNGGDGSPEMVGNTSIEEVQTIQRLKDEKDATVKQNMQLQREIEMLKHRRNRKSVAGFSLRFAGFVGIVGILLGFILNLVFSPSPAPTPSP